MLELWGPSDIGCSTRPADQIVSKITARYLQRRAAYTGMSVSCVCCPVGFHATARRSSVLASMTRRCTKESPSEREVRCVLDLMGHRRLAGYVSEQEIAGAGMLRIDVPAEAGLQFYSLLHHANYGRDRARRGADPAAGAGPSVEAATGHGRRSRQQRRRWPRAAMTIARGRQSFALRQPSGCPLSTRCQHSPAGAGGGRSEVGDSQLSELPVAGRRHAIGDGDERILKRAQHGLGVDGLRACSIIRIVGVNTLAVTTSRFWPITRSFAA